MTQNAPSIAAITRLFELAARSLHSAGFAGGLYPAQWTALRYLAQAAPAERTAAKLARFQQMAVGPVTRTVRTLIAKGLLIEAGSAGHHRSKRLDLTPEGITLLQDDPLLAVDAELSKLSTQEGRALSTILVRIISHLQASHDGSADVMLSLDDPKSS